MAKCELCGEWAGLFSDVHFDCKEAKEKGVSLEELRRHALPRSGERVPVTGVRRSDIVWGVFWGMWAFAASAGVLSLIVAAIRIMAGS